jgi:hypothetical protein
MDRWCALSQIESGDNDRAVGAAGELSRYQIKPDLWRRYALPKADCLKPQDALVVARALMKQRCAEFEETFHRTPTDFEFYVLWNAPAQIQKPAPAVRERAERFCNLVASSEKSAFSDLKAGPATGGGETAKE